MSYVFELSKLLKISKKSFVESCHHFQDYLTGMKFFSKRKIVLLLMTQKQRHFNLQNMLWKIQKHFLIVGGLPKKK